MKPTYVELHVTAPDGEIYTHTILNKLATSVTEDGSDITAQLVLSPEEVRRLTPDQPQQVKQATPAAEPAEVANTFGNAELDYAWNILEHKRLVMHYLQTAVCDLFERAALHDYSKFTPEEFWAYAKALPRFQAVEYGSEEYLDVVRSIKPAIHHHFMANRHHPEHFRKGVDDMTLIDLLEMVCDWIAASQRVPGDTLRLDLNKERFGLSDQLYGIIERTVKALLPPPLPPIAPDTETE